MTEIEMTEKQDGALAELLRAFKRGDLSEEDAIENLREHAGIEHLAIGKFDTGREQRTGIPEAILGEGKRPEDVVATFEHFLERDEQLIATRVTPPILEALKAQVPGLYHHEQARIAAVHPPEKAAKLPGSVAVLSAGTLDLPVAYEAAQMSMMYGHETRTIFDVGVAGIHRLFSQIENFKDVDVIIVVAGMDGALPSVVAGLMPQPVIAVPTNVGYGASFGGVAAMLTMLNSCAPGVAVCNIDNGFGAAVLASKILKRIASRG